MRWKRLVAGAALVVTMLFSGVAAANDGFDYYTAAYEFYNKAKTATSLKETSDAYADAISYIAKAVEREPDNFNYLTLASLIYRGKGGASYAQNYFLRAEKVVVEKIKENPNNIDFRVKRAILCFAGDGAFSNKAFKYRKEAQREANITVALYKKAIKEDGENKNIKKQAAMAYLIKGNKRECKKLLQEADKATLDLYERTVEKKKWLWNVTEIEKEFLLYVMMDTENENRLQ